MSAFNVVNLLDGAPVDLGQHLAGGWGPAQLLDLEAHATHDLDAVDGEICLFVLEGTGTIVLGDNQASLVVGTGVTLLQGSAATITATSSMQLFAAWLTA